VPKNYIFLGVFTLLHAVMIGGVVAVYAQYGNTVVQAFTSTMAMTIGITCVACRDTSLRKDRTGFMIVACVSLFFSLIACVILSMFMQSRTLHLVVIVIVMVILSIYLYWDTLQILGGGHKKYADNIGHDDYIIGAIIIYLDIINIFLYLLQLFGIAGGN
jgi:FtsH-binding integral membrane protein